MCGFVERRTAPRGTPARGARAWRANRHRPACRPPRRCAPAARPRRRVRRYVSWKWSIGNSAFRRQVEGIVLAFLGAFAQFDAALGRGLRCRARAVLTAARLVVAAIGRRRQVVPGERLAGPSSARRRRAATSGRRNARRAASWRRSPARRALRRRAFSPAPGAVPPWLVRAATELPRPTAPRTRPRRSARRSPAARPAAAASSAQPLALGQLDRRAGDMVRLAERQPGLAHQPVGQVGRGGIAEFGRLRASGRCGKSRRRSSRSSPRSTGRAGRQPRTPAACRPACPSNRPAAGPSSSPSARSGSR